MGIGKAGVKQVARQEWGEEEYIWTDVAEWRVTSVEIPELVRKLSERWGGSGRRAHGKS